MLFLKHHRQYWRIYLRYLIAAFVISFTSMLCVTMSEGKPILSEGIYQILIYLSIDL